MNIVKYKINFIFLILNIRIQYNFQYIGYLKIIYILFYFLFIL